MKKSELETALRGHFGSEVYDALKESGTALPRICEMAAVAWFVKPPVNYSGKGRVKLVRHALSNLYELGAFRFEDESD
jgi:hypothetical protein